MPLYMIQARFTSTAWEALYASNADRREVLSKMLKDAGGRLIDYYLIAQDHGRPGAGQHGGQVDDAKAVKRAGHDAGPLCRDRSSSLLIPNLDDKNPSHGS